MTDIVEVEFDIRGTNPVNTFKGEKIPLTDKTLNWVLPNASPFFAQPAKSTDLPIVKVYNAAGGLLVLNRDYFLEEEFEPFVKAAGRRIVCFIRVSDEVLADNAFITVDYQSIGAWFVPRNNMEDWLTQINSGGVHPIPWSLVFKVPATLPSSYHSHSVYTEIGDWFELTFFFEQLEGIRRTRDPEVSDKLQQVVDDAYAALNKARDDQMVRLTSHDQNYSNPHELDAASIDMANLNNYATATPAEDLAGTRNDVFSTPYGVIQLAKQNTPDTSGIMDSGLLPISSFGGETFIPPSIYGSFEGMGQVNECSGICLEPGGILTILTNHQDGRTKGLYFTTVSDYNNANLKINYTNYKYQPPALTALGVVPDAIVSGSGGKVIMTGMRSTLNWYVALVAGTFDPASHAYVKCDMTAVNNVFGGFNHDSSVIHHMGDYLVLVVSYLAPTGISRQQFFKVATADVRAGKAVAWAKMPVTYQNWDGTQFTNADYMECATPVLNSAQNRYTRVGPFMFTQPIIAMSTLRRHLSFSAPKPNAVGTYLYHQIAYTHFQYTEGLVTKVYAGVFDLYFELNPATGVFTLKDKTLPTTMDFLNGDTEVSYVKYNHLRNALVQFTCPATVILGTGELITTFLAEGGGNFPTRLEVMKFTGRASPAAVLGTLLSTDQIAVASRVETNPTVQPPTLNGTSPGTLCYEWDGELFDTIDQAGYNPATGAYFRQSYYRQVSGGYAVRDGVNNLTVGNVMSRPLTTKIYKANINYRDGVISVTGSAAELAAGGVECGSTALSMMGWSSLYQDTQYVPYNTDMRAPAAGNVLFSFPRTHKRTLDLGLKTATYLPDTFYGIREAIRTKLKAYVPAAANTPSWAFTINVLGAESGYMFKGLNLALVAVNWIDTPTLKYKTQLLLVRPVVEAPNADHPGVYLITDFTVLHAPTPFNNHANSLSYPSIPQYFFFDTFSTKPYVNIYRDGNVLKVLYISAFAVQDTNIGNSPLRMVFDLNISTNQILNIASGGTNSYTGEMLTMIPQVGMTDITLTINDPVNNDIVQAAPYPFDYTGSAASLFRKGSTWYCTSSVYPEVGWTIFIQDSIRVIINGAVYTVPGGSIDLRDVDAAPANKTFYLYVTVEDDEPKYVLSGIALRKNNALIRVATIVTNANQILTLVRERAFMVGDLLLSYTREGGIIPVSTGYPQDTGQFAFLSNAELLP